MMKSNIDLTDSEIFSRPRRDSIKIAQYEHFPWDTIILGQITCEDDLGINEVVLTGDKYTRESKMLARQENSGEYCYCCGVSIVKLPWARRFGLCKRCEDQLEDGLGHKKEIPWNKKPPNYREDSDRILRL